MARGSLAGLGLVAVLALPSARADPGFSLAGAAARYDAIERFASGTTANTESGPLLGGRVKVWWDGQPWRVGVGVGHLSGTVDYRGRTQIGFPIRTHTRIAIDEAALEGQWRFAEQEPFRAALTLALGQRRIDRRIAPTLFSTPLTEVLQWRYAQLGAQTRWSFGDGWYAAADVNIEQGLGARLGVNFHGPADAVELAPGHGRLGHRVGLELGRALGKHATLSLRASQSRNPYGASAPAPFSRGGIVTGQVRYPGSVQRLNEVQLLLEANWN